MTVIVVIPARGGSKGIPRKCIRPVAGKPMIYYAIRASLACARVDRVVVSTDDDEIALLAERFGAEVLRRPTELADDVTPLDPVVVNAVVAAERDGRARYDLVVTVQPTSPLIETADIDGALSMFEAEPTLDTVLSVVDDRHLNWTVADGRPVPRYEARVNRQMLPPNFRETGAVIACTRGQLDSGTRIGSRVGLLQVPAARSVDIDSVADLALCDSMLRRRRIVFTVVGYPEVGLGHAYRALLLAHELVQYDLHFVCGRRSALAAEVIGRHNYQVELCEDDDIAATVLARQPDLVINDILDTDADYVLTLKRGGAKVVNFEDLGAGGAMADLVINALYDGNPEDPRLLVGPDYFCLRDEFLYLPPRPQRSDVARALVTFGGVDENDLTTRVVQRLVPLCAPRNIVIDVVLGPGYRHRARLDATVARLGYSGLRILGATSRISDVMFYADIAVTSGGRTVLELASLRVPTLVLCQNDRETTHRFAAWDNGVVNLGHHARINDDVVTERLSAMLGDSELRAEMRERAARWDLSNGKRKVIKSITSLLD